MFKKHLKDYFVPHEGNNYAPNSLERAAVVGILFLVILSFAATNILSVLWTSSSWLVGSVLPAVVVELTNEERSDASLGTLRRSTTLDQAAQLKAQDMAKHEYFAHYSPDGVSPWHWFGETKYNFVHAGENLAIHFTDSGDVIEAWMDSPTHRANILNGNYTEIGVGTAEGTYEGFKTVYVVQLFGTPAAPTPVAVVRPAAIPVVAGNTTDTAIAITPKEDTEVLSESITLSETVVIKEAEVVPITITETISEEDASKSEAAIVPVPKEQSEVQEMKVTDTGIVLYSDFISTSTGGVPAIIEPTTGTTDTTPFYAEAATQPHRILQMLYMVIGACVFISLMFSVFIEIKRQQPLQIAYGVGLLSLMFTLFYIHSVLSHGALII